VLGFREEGQHRLVDLDECPVLSSEIVAAFPALRRLAALLATDTQSISVAVTRLDHGLDVVITSGRKLIGADLATRLAAEAETARLVRLIVDSESIVERGKPVLTLGGVPLELPTGIFLQAVPEAERAMTRLILDALPKKPKRIVDLFSGIGTFTFPLARQAPVLAVDGDKRAIAALAHAAKRAPGTRPIETRVRDLFREPLSRKELEPFDVAVFDPPRAGAAAQAEMLAKSQVPLVIAVSCSPATLARDVRTLVDGGYRLGRVTPIDQFVASPHIEAVAVLRR
jgi:23S rRNA (uracil1939-C5)-methyltransferase